MAELSIKEKRTVEDFLKMDGGYVSDFSDRTFRDFVGSMLIRILTIPNIRLKEHQKQTV